MTITDLINLKRELLLAHEHALREVASLAESICTRLDLRLCDSDVHDQRDGLCHFVRFWPNGALLDKAQAAELVRPLLPPGWAINTDTGKEWIDVLGTLNGHRLVLTIYTAK